MKNHTEVLIFRTAICAGASQISLDGRGEIAFANFSSPRRIRSGMGISVKISGKYSLLSIGIMFIIISHAAWLWEGIVTMYEVGEFVNRGFLHGFWLPLYGTGSLFLIYLFGGKKQSFWKIFIGSAAICAMIEYGTAAVLENLFHRKWWDYGYIGFDLKGRICGPAVLLFGLAGYFLVCLLAPYLDRQIQKMSLPLQKTICIIFVILLLLDFGISIFYPNTGYGITF